MSIFIELDKRRELRFTDEHFFKMVELFYAREGGSMIAKAGNLSLRQGLQYIIFMGLIHEDPELTIDRVGEILTDYLGSAEGMGNNARHQSELHDAIDKAQAEWGKNLAFFMDPLSNEHH